MDDLPKRQTFVCSHRLWRKRLGPWSKSGLTHGIRDFGLRIGLPKLNGPQILRRSFGSWLVAAGQPLIEVSRMMGHSSVTVTERHYIRFLPGRRGKVDDL